MQEQTPAGVTPPVEQDDPYKPSAPVSLDSTTQPALTPLEQKTPHPSAGTASASAAPQSRLTLQQVIQTALKADPKIQAGLEVINQAKTDLLTASLPPNPQLSSSQTLIPLDRPFTVDRTGGPPQFDVGISYPID